MSEIFFKEYENCRLCPRQCQVNRYKTKGFCGEKSDLSIDAVLLHLGEEPCISFNNGSGTIFFTGCSLRCPFCQNMQISQTSTHKKFYSMEKFVEEMESLIRSGAENINFVTPDHFSPHIIEGIKNLKKKGYKIPFIYNCSGFQSIEHLKSVIDDIDIFLFDYKFADPDVAKKILATENYPEVCERALEFIFKNKGNLKLDSNGKAISGVLVRHLLMPGFVHNSLHVFNNLLVDYGNKIYFSLMNQYSPKYLKPGFEYLNHRVSNEEYKEVVDHVLGLGFVNGYIQDFLDSDDEFLPDFNNKTVFGNRTS